jgi:WD40 repeat protein/serine/threonine protein kinase/tetratricopeptide (TPR) repeat protein
MNSSSDARNPVELLAEEFLDRKRRGEQPTLREYLERHPDLADEIRDLFPALLMMEDLGESSGATTGSLAADGVALGTRLQRLGDYRILREIGRGGMGVVYEAEQESLGRRVALKVLSAGALADPKQVRRFEREAKAAARLHHTNIVPVFGVGHQDGHHYFVMQFIAGLGLDAVLEDLRRLRRAKSEAGSSPSPAPSARAAGERFARGVTAADVARSLMAGRFALNGPPADGEPTEPFDTDAAATPPNGPPADASSTSAILPGSSGLSSSSDPDRQFFRSVARIGIQVAEALEYANRQGILHRDVKPSNLLLDNRGNVWVADFGLAKTGEADDLTHTGDILGTIRYMAPERFAGRCDARSDVYSLGLTLYELVALRPAFEASDRHRLMERVIHENPERLKRLAPGVPRDLETIVAKAMAREPAGRYATAGALAEDLCRFVEDRPIRARRISPMERAWRWCRRNKVVASSIGLAALTLVGVAVLAVLHASQQAHLATARKLYANEQAHRADEQAEATRKIARLAADLETESGRLRTALSESNRRLATLDLERGRVAFDKDQIGVGLLWTVEALRMATAAGDELGRHLALANLSAWRRELVEPKVLVCHGDWVSSVAFSPDGQMILTGSDDKTARLWDATTGQPIGQPIVHPQGVTSVAFSPDGQTILTGSRDNTAQLWHASTGRPLGVPLAHQGLVRSAAFSPDGRTFLTGSQTGQVQLWDAATRRPLGGPLVHPNYLGFAGFSADGRAIVTGGTDGRMRFWDAATGRPLGLPRPTYDFDSNLAFSPDGRMILAATSHKTARLWDARSGQPLGETPEHAGTVYRVAFRPDGRTFFTGGDAGVQAWDAHTLRRLGRPLEHQGTVSSLALSPDGKTLVTGCEDGTVRLWDAAVGQAVGRPLDYGIEVFCAASTSDGRGLLTGGRDGKVRRWDLASGRLLGQPVEHGSWVTVVASSPDGRAILTGGRDGTARLWDAGTGRPFGRPVKHSDTVWSVAFSPDGQTILTASTDKTARLWDAAAGSPIVPPLEHQYAVSAVAFSPDGRSFLTGSIGRTARLWDAATGRPLGPPLAYPGFVLGVAFSPDGKTIAIGGSDNTVRLWEAATGKPVGAPVAHPGRVHTVAFSPDGKTILAGGSEWGARLWDAATGSPIGPPFDPAKLSGELTSGVRSLGFAADGRLLFTSDPAMARVWDAPAPLPDYPPRLSAWIEAATRLALDQRGVVRVLDRDAWLERRRRVESLGGPPPADPAPRLDPILYGGDPAARGDALTARGWWDQAEAAYAEAARARPRNPSVRDVLARLHARLGRLDRAAAELAEASRWIPDDARLPRLRALLLLESGDRAGWRDACTALLDRFGGTIDPWAAREVARAWALAPGPAGDPAAPLRLADLAIGLDKDPFGAGAADAKAEAVTTLGAALHRAGRSDQAIGRLEEAIRARGGAGSPRDWAFLALAHHRLGHRAEARRWLDRLREHRPSEDPARFWDELEIRLLRSEAEAVILFDPAFPDDPFAR